MNKLNNEIELAGIDYDELKHDTVGQLTLDIDDHRLSALASVEALIQLILVNSELTKSIFVNVNEQVDVLSGIAKQLRKI